MNASHQNGTRRRVVTHVAVIGTAVVAGFALGASGASLALWKDAAGFTGQIADGYEYFAAGPPGATQPAVDGTATVEVGADDATALVDEGTIAIPMQTDSVSQGNKGLRYRVIEPDWGDGVFAAADVAVFPVDAAGECTTDAVPPQDDALSSTPVSAEYSDDETPVTEFWCLVATLDGLPGAGDYENTVHATAKDDADAEASDDDSWHAVVTSALDPADEDDHAIEFRYQTFRPGEATP